MCGDWRECVSVSVFHIRTRSKNGLSSTEVDLVDWDGALTTDELVLEKKCPRVQVSASIFFLFYSTLTRLLFSCLYKVLKIY